MNEFKSFYKTVKGGEGDKCHYPTRLDPYGKGCHYDCTYCYAKKLLDFRKLWHPDNVAVADKEKITKRIQKIEPGSVVRLGGMTDPFQPIEMSKGNTYHTIRELNRQSVHYLIVTKAPLVATQKYLNILNKELAHIQVSVPTTNDKVLEMTDNAPPYNARIKAIERLEREGYDVSIRLSPFLYETADYDLLNKVRVSKCLVEFLRVTPSLMEKMKPYITTEKYKHKEGGYRHLTLEEKQKALQNLKYEEISVCDDVQEHYEYWEQHYNPNPRDCCNLRL